MSAPLVYVTRIIPPTGTKILEQFCNVRAFEDDIDFIPRETLLKGVVGVDGILCDPPDKIDKELLDAAGPNLKVVSTMSSGLDHIDLELCKARGIRVGNTQGVVTDTTAETAIALLLATSRRLKEAFSAVVDGGWGSWEKGMYLCGRGLAGNIVGIVGLGRVGLAIAKRLQPFGISKIVYSGNTQKTWDKDVSAEFVPFNSLLQQADFVIACCSMNKENVHLFNKDAFRKMKKNAIFINVSRGTLVNQDDLYEALKSGTILAAGLDVTSPEPLPHDNPLHTLRNCTITPHLGSATISARNAVSEMAAKNLVTGLKDQKMPCPVC